MLSIKFSLFKNLFFIGLCIFLFNLKGQNTSNKTSSELYHDLQKLNTIGSVLYIAAHPDDENTRLLSYLSKEKKIRTAYLSLTRGDGGQNLIGNQKGALLGMIRTEELVEARKTDGAEQFFSRANDFGYSKTPEETLDIWNKKEVLSDMVWTIRNFKPDVIICRFPTTGEGGHGHHTASALLAMEAFDLAASSTAFPEQLKFVSVWKTKRMYWNTFNFGTVNTTNPNQIQINVGTFNTLLGKSCGEIAAESRSKHRSQGFGTSKQRGESIEYFKYMKGDSAVNDLFEGINTNWNQFENGKLIQSQIEKGLKLFNFTQPEKNIPQLLKIKKLLSNFNKNNHWLELKSKELNQIIANCLGLFIETYHQEYTVVNNQNININTQFVVRNPYQIKLKKLEFLNIKDSSIDFNCKNNVLHQFKNNITIPNRLDYSSPFWLKEKGSNGLLNIQSQKEVNLVNQHQKIPIIYSFEIDGEVLIIESFLKHKYTDPSKGELYRPIEVLPPVVFTNFQKNIFLNQTKEKTIQLTVKAHINNFEGELLFKNNSNVAIEISNNQIKINKKGEEQTFEFKIKVNSQLKFIVLEPYIKTANGDFDLNIQRIDYEHITNLVLLQKTEIHLSMLDVQISKKPIAYIEGAGDDVAKSLVQLGYQLQIISEEQLKNLDLNQFQTIICGVRAYNVHTYLQIYQAKLMKYIENGGNLIVQYNTNSRVGPIQLNIGPFPFSISRERVTNENSPIVFSNPKHPILNQPNTIDSSDFNNWVQERGIYFAEKMSAEYQTILSLNDPNEPLKDGSIIHCVYGKGNFVYTGLSFFRQLPEGVEGALKLFSNMIELKQN